MDILGKTMRDKISNFEGVIVSKHEYLESVTEYGVQPLVGEYGKLLQIKYFVASRLVEIEYCPPKELTSNSNSDI